MVITLEALGMCVSALPRVAAQQCSGQQLNPQPVDHKSSDPLYLVTELQLLLVIIRSKDTSGVVQFMVHKGRVETVDAGRCGECYMHCSVLCLVGFIRMQTAI